MTQTSRNSIKVLLVTFISVSWNKSKGEWIKEWMFSARRSKTAQRETAFLFVDQRCCKDASDVTLTFVRLRKCFKMWNPRFSLHAVLTCTDMYFASSHSPPQVLPPSHILHRAAIWLSSDHPWENLRGLFYSTFQWGFGFPDETFLPKIPWICFALPSARRAHRKHLVSCNPIYIWKKKNWKMMNKPFVFSVFFLLSCLSVLKYHLVQICTYILCDILFVLSILA